MKNILYKVTVSQIIGSCRIGDLPEQTIVNEFIFEVKTKAVKFGKRYNKKVTKATISCIEG